MLCLSDYVTCRKKYYNQSRDSISQLWNTVGTYLPLKIKCELQAIMFHETLMVRFIRKYYIDWSPGQ